MTTPRVTVPPQVLEAIAFNLCSLHDFDVAFVRENERFATAVITEYGRTLSAAPAPEGGAAEAGEVLDLLTHAKDAVHKIAALRRQLGPIASQAQTAGWAISLAMRHLRAQPQAREDARPVAWLETNRTNGERRATVRQPSDTPTMRKRWTYTPLYTHPAPDALRGGLRDRYVAIALMVERAWTAGEPDHVIARTARKALAALQGEQKGGA